MARAIWQKTIIDNTGAPSNGAQVTVTIQGGGAATIFSAQSGGSARTNPFTTGSDGIARFYAERGYYNVAIFKDGQTVTFPWNNLGDKNLFDDLGTASFKNVNDMGPVITSSLAITGNDFESVGARGIHMGNTPAGSVLYSINFDNNVYQDFSIFTNTLTLGSGGFSRVFLDQSGNLGVGNFAPEAKLHVNGDIIADGVFLGGKVAANNLDDYEEGTVPITNLTVGGSTVTNLTGSLKYTKIGRQVFIGVRVFYTSGNAVNIGGTLEIALPFVVANNSSGINSTIINAGGLNYPSGYMLYAFQNEAKAILYINNNLNLASNLAANTGDFVFVSNINYETN